MRRGAKPAKAKVEAKLAVPRQSLKNEDPRVRDLEKRLAEALAQQTATAEILRVMSDSPTDVRPVFDAIAESAVRLCGAHIGGVYKFDGELFDLVAHRNFTPESLEALRRKLPDQRGATRCRGEPSSSER